MCCFFIYITVILVTWETIHAALPPHDASQKLQFQITDIFLAGLFYVIWLTIARSVLGPNKPDFHARFLACAVIFLFSTFTGFLFSFDMRRFFESRTHFYIFLIFMLLLFPFVFPLVIPLWLLRRGWFHWF